MILCYSSKNKLYYILHVNAPIQKVCALRWETIVHFVDIGGIVDQHCLNFLLFCWYQCRGIVNYHCLNFLLLWWYQCRGIVNYHCLNFLLLCWYQCCGIVNYHCLNFLLFCWYWWNCRPTLFKLSFLKALYCNIFSKCSLQWIKKTTVQLCKYLTSNLSIVIGLKVS